MLQALGNTRMVPIVRVPWNDSVIVKRVLDTGATTLLFPLVQTADDAALAVAATRYPPEGHRGVAGMGRASRYGTTPNYVATANRQIGVVLQLETAVALERLEAVAEVDGVDALFVGPADLSASMGHVGQPTHPAVVDRMAQAVRRAKDVGKPIGTLGATPEQVAQYRAIGFDFVAIASDLGLLMRSAQAALAALRTQEVAHVHTLSGGTRAAE
jgi:2-dehydro-3-deoxyglucarate aldolase